MPTDRAQDDWIRLVLGIALAGDAMPETDLAGEDSVEEAPPGASERVIWRTAKDQVDSKLNNLGASLRRFNHPDLNRIADFGINGITAGETVRLNKALIEYEAAGGDRKAAAAKALQTAIANFRKVIDTNPVVRRIDVNPFGVKPNMRATLGGALDRIEGMLP